MSPHFTKNNEDMLAAAAQCIELRQHLPSLVLMYSHIDTLAWAGSTKAEGAVRKNFEEWVARWLLPELAAEYPTLTATEIYAARCGVLHTLTSTSKLSAAGQARELAYAWGTARANALDEALAGTPLGPKLVTVHYNALLDGLRKAVRKFIAAADSDPDLKQRLEQAAGRHYQTVPTGAR